MPAISRFAASVKTEGAFAVLAVARRGADEPPVVVLTDSQGRTVSFKNTVVIMTSNIASKVIQDLPESERDRMTTLVEAELKQALHQALRQNGSNLKEWFVDKAREFLLEQDTQLPLTLESEHEKRGDST